MGEEHDRLGNDVKGSISGWCLRFLSWGLLIAEDTLSEPPFLSLAKGNEPSDALNHLGNPSSIL